MHLFFMGPCHAGLWSPTVVLAFSQRMRVPHLANYPPTSETSSWSEPRRRLMKHEDMIKIRFFLSAEAYIVIVFVIFSIVDKEFSIAL